MTSTQFIQTLFQLDYQYRVTLISTVVYMVFYVLLRLFALRILVHLFLNPFYSVVHTLYLFHPQSHSYTHTISHNHAQTKTNNGSSQIRTHKDERERKQREAGKGVKCIAVGMLPKQNETLWEKVSQPSYCEFNGWQCCIALCIRLYLSVPLQHSISIHSGRNAHPTT